MARGEISYTPRGLHDFSNRLTSMGLHFKRGRLDREEDTSRKKQVHCYQCIFTGFWISCVGSCLWRWLLTMDLLVD